MTARRASTSPANKIISQVAIDTERIAPLALKYPDGKLMIVIPAHRELILQAARESKTTIFIVTGARLLVYYTDDCQCSSVPTKDPTDFFETFQRLQIEAMQAKQARESVTI